MSEKNNSIQMFEDRQIRTAWNAEQEEWYFSVTDVIAVLTDSADPKQYIKKMRSRDSELDARWGTICTLTSMVASDGKKYRTNAATMEGIFRIIQSVTSPKVEPLKAWLAKVGSERIEETIDPEKAIDRAFATYLKKGYNVMAGQFLRPGLLPCLCKHFPDGSGFPRQAVILLNIIYQSHTLLVREQTQF